MAKRVEKMKQFFEKFLFDLTKKWKKCEVSLLNKFITF